MRIGRFAHDGETRVGIFGDDRVAVADVGSYGEALGRVTNGDSLDRLDESYPLDEITYLPPTMPANAVFATALNYRSHVDETDMATPERPLVFLKLYRSLVGHGQPIANHVSVTDRLDYEAELAAVVGSTARDVDPEAALDHVAGYTILNDTSARDVQRMMVGDTERMDWFSGKAMQSTTPVGPYVVTPGAVGDAMDARIISRVNGRRMQDESTRLMIRSVAELVSFLSTRVELTPGDVVATGTPEGVGEFKDVTLSDGDRVTIEIEGIGTLENVVEDRRG